MIRLAGFFVGLICISASVTTIAAPQSGPLQKIEALEARIDFLETQLSNQKAPQPNQAIFTLSPELVANPDSQPKVAQVIHLSKIESVQSITTAPVQIFGYIFQVKVIGEDFDHTVGLFDTEESSTGYLDDLVNWMQSGGAQPLPENFGGVSAFL